MKQRSLQALHAAAVVAFLSMTVMAYAQQPKIPPRYKASPLHVAQLPKFCWQQYVDGSLSGPQYSIMSSSCGSEMNHFCPALVFLMQAQSPVLPKNERKGAMGQAVKEINYTLRGMKPGCHITAEVHAARDKARVLAPIIGVQ